MKKFNNYMQGLGLLVMMLVTLTFTFVVQVIWYVWHLVVIGLFTKKSLTERLVDDNSCSQGLLRLNDFMVNWLQRTYPDVFFGEGNWVIVEEDEHADE